MVIPDSVIPNSVIPDSTLARYTSFRYTSFSAPLKIFIFVVFPAITFNLLRRSAEPLAVSGVHDLRSEDVPAVGVQVRRRLELRARHELRAGGRDAQKGRRRDEAAVQRALPRRGGLRLQVSEEGQSRSIEIFVTHLEMLD